MLIPLVRVERASNGMSVEFARCGKVLVNLMNLVEIERVKLAGLPQVILIKTTSGSGFYTAPDGEDPKAYYTKWFGGQYDYLFGDQS